MQRIAKWRVAVVDGGDSVCTCGPASQRREMKGLVRCIPSVRGLDEEETRGVPVDNRK